jgi:hypothetical protein
VKNTDRNLEDKWIDVDDQQAIEYFYDSNRRCYNISNDDLRFIRMLAKKTQLVNKKSEVDFAHGILLFSLIKNYPSSHVKVAEIGTAKGFSALCMSAAIKSGGKSGIVMTTDIIPNWVERYWNDVGDLEGKISRGNFIEEEFATLRANIMFLSMASFNISNTIDFPEINVWFFDGVHSPKAIRNEYTVAKKSVSSNTIYIFDDCTEDYKDYRTEVESLLTGDGMIYNLISSKWGRKKFYVASKNGIHNEILRLNKR